MINRNLKKHKSLDGVHTSRYNPNVLFNEENEIMNNNNDYDIDYEKQYNGSHTDVRQLKIAALRLQCLEKESHHANKIKTIPSKQKSLSHTDVHSKLQKTKIPIYHYVKNPSYTVFAPKNSDCHEEPFDVIVDENSDQPLMHYKDSNNHGHRQRNKHLSKINKECFIEATALKKNYNTNAYEEMRRVETPIMMTTISENEETPNDPDLTQSASSPESRQCMGDNYYGNNIIRKRKTHNPFEHNNNPHKMEHHRTKNNYFREQLSKTLVNLNTLQGEHDSLKHKWNDLKLKNQALLSECAEAQYFKQRNNQLEKKISELTEALLQKDAIFARKSSEMENIERSTEYMQEKMVQLTGEVERLKSLLSEQDDRIKESTWLRQVDVMKDQELKLLHNQLIDVRGKIRVVARFKPEANNVFEFSGLDTLRINPAVLTVDGKAKHIRFNRIFDPKSSQEDIFEEVAPYVTSFVDGYNVCILTFGQTGSGKTYTMHGNRTYPGITNRVYPYITSLLKKRALWEYTLHVSIIQIYNETIMDLLDDKISFLSLIDNGDTVVIKDMTEHQVRCDADMQHLIQLGRRRRSTSKTIFNAESSRSHFLVILKIEGRCRSEDRFMRSMLTLCDLAGFEKTADLPKQSAQVNESKYIGKSLTGLGRVLQALQKGDRSIPYRDSKLTHILKPSLSGEAKCVLILTLSTKSENLSGSVRTLEMGQQALAISIRRVYNYGKTRPSSVTRSAGTINKTPPN